MNKWIKLALSIGFCLMFCCLSIGYASLNDQLFVSGSVSYHYVPEETEQKPDQPVVGGEGGEGKLILTAGDEIFNGGKDKKGTADIVLTETTATQYKCTITFTIDKDAKKVDIDTYIHFTFNGVKYSLQLNDDNEVEMDSIGSDSKKKFISDWTATAGTYQVNVIIDKSKLNTANSGKEIGSWTGPYAVKTASASYSLDTSNVRNLPVSTTEQATFDLESKPNLLLTLTPDEGYLLPESFTITIGETAYEINTNGENDYETLFFDIESSTLYILGDLLPTDGSAIFLEACAAPEAPPYRVAGNLQNLTMPHYAADSGLYIQLMPQEGYVLPKTFCVLIGQTDFVIYTDEPAEGENPAGMGFDRLESKLYISGALLPTDGSEILITASGEVPVKEETEEVPAESEDLAEKITKEPPEEPAQTPTEATAEEKKPEEESAGTSGKETDSLSTESTATEPTETQTPAVESPAAEQPED